MRIKARRRKLDTYWLVIFLIVGGVCLLVWPERAGMIVGVLMILTGVWEGVRRA